MSFDAGSIEAKLTLDRTPFTTGLGQAREDGDRFAEQKFEATLSANDEPARDKIREAELAGDEFAHKDYTATLGVDKSQVDEALKGAGAEAKGAAAGAGGGVGGMVLGWAALIAAAAGAAGGALTAGVGGAFIALAAIAVHSDQQIQDNFEQVVRNMKQQTVDAAQVVIPAINQNLQQLNGFVKTLGPGLAGAFAYAGPDLAVLTTGVENMVSHLMPGFITEMQNSYPAVNGLALLMGSLGTTVSTVMTEMALDSTNMGQDLQSVGVIVDSVVGGAGNLIVDLANMWAQQSGRIESFFGTLMNTVQGLAAGALPLFGSSLGVVLNVLNGLLSVLAPVNGQLGTLGVIALDAFGAFKVVSGINSMVSDFGNSVSGLGTKMEKAGTSGAGFVKNLGSSIGTLGPLIGGAVALLGFMFQKVGENAAEAQTALDTQRRDTQDFQSILQQTGGTVDQFTGQAVQAKVQTQEWASGLQYLGLNSEIASGAIMGNKDAYGQVLQQGNLYADMLKTAGGMLAVTNPALYAQAQSAVAAAHGVESMSGAWSNATQQYKDNTTAATDASAPNAQLAKDIETLSNNASTAAQKLQALVDIQKQEDGGVLSLAESVNSADKKLTSFNDTLAKGVDKHLGYGNALLTESGLLNTTSKNAQSLFDQYDAMVPLLDNIVQHTYDKAVADGKSKDAAEGLAAQAAQAYIPALEKEGEAFGLTKIQIDKVLQSMGLIPRDIATNYADNGSVAKKHADDLHGAITGVPTLWSTTLGANTSPALNALGGLRQNLYTLPNPWVTIFGNTNPARGAWIGLFDDIQRYHPVITPQFAFGQGIGHASGGTIDPNKPAILNEHGPELVFPTRQAYVATANETRQITSTLSDPRRGSSSSPVQDGAWTPTQMALLSQALTQAVQSAFNAAKMTMDGQGLVRFVNSENVRNKGRS